MLPYDTLYTCSCFQTLTISNSPLSAALVVMVLSKERQAELRAQKALKEGRIGFKPRGAANKAAFEDLKATFENKTQEINKHTSSEADRIIENNRSCLSCH